MEEPLFLGVEDVEKLHAMSLQRFGGSEGLRDRNAFECAVHHPRNICYYDQGDLFDMAALLLPYRSGSSLPGREQANGSRCRNRVPQ